MPMLAVPVRSDVAAKYSSSCAPPGGPVRTTVCAQLGVLAKLTFTDAYQFRRFMLPDTRRYGNRMFGSAGRARNRTNAAGIMGG